MTYPAALPAERCPLEQRVLRFGTFAFRWRSFTPLVLFIWMFFESNDFHFAFGNPQFDFMLQVLCLGIVLLGSALRIYTTGFAGDASSGRNTKCQVADCLNTCGIYSIVRHPLYLSNMIIFIGLAIKTFNVETVIVISLFLAITYVPIMMVEEAFLAQKFGDVYHTWAKNTPALLPSFTNRCTAFSKFDWKRVLRMEPDGLMATISAFMAVELLRNYFILERVMLHPVWIGLWGVSTAGWLVLKFLKKKTGVLR